MMTRTAAPAPTAHDVAVATAVREVESAIAAVKRAERATERLDGVDALLVHGAALRAGMDLEYALDELRPRPAAADVSTPLCARGHAGAHHTAVPAVDGRAGCRAKDVTWAGRCACERTS